MSCPKILLKSFLGFSLCASYLASAQRPYGYAADAIWLPPKCSTITNGTCLGEDKIINCAWILDKPEEPKSYKYVNLTCVCETVNYQSCPACKGPNLHLYFFWLYLWCNPPTPPNYPQTWEGLPSDWNSPPPTFNVLEIPKIRGETTDYDKQNGASNFYEKTNIFRGFASYYYQPLATIKYYQTSSTPQCALTCGWFQKHWTQEDAIIEGSLLYNSTWTYSWPTHLPKILPFKIGNNVSVSASANGNQSGLYLDLNLTCLGWTWKDFQTQCPETCTTPFQRTGFLNWLYGVCGNISGFEGLPSDWSNSLVPYQVQNSTSKVLDSLPSCLKSSNSTDCNVRNAEIECFTSGCSSVDKDGVCDTVFNFDLGCFCARMKYGVACRQQCKPYGERREHLEWLDENCGSDTLPGNWPRLLDIQKSDLMPWTWQLRSNVTTTQSSAAPTKCPSASSKLLAFAAVNIIMALLLPIIGRRTVIKKLTFGYFGRQESRRWFLTGPVAVALNLVSNAINASIIKGIPGFGSTDVTQLTFFWCTRPRIAWLIVILLPVQAEKSMYFSSTASILFSETVLQLFSSYYFINGLDFARRNRFLLRGTLQQSGYAGRAYLMFAGSVLWVVAIPIAIISCMWSVFGINARIMELGKIWVETRKLCKVNCSIGKTQLEALRTTSTSISSLTMNATKHRIDVKALVSELLSDVKNTELCWDEIVKIWELMMPEVRELFRQKYAIQKRLRKAEDTLQRTSHWSDKRNFRAREAHEARQASQEFDQQWLSILSLHQNTAIAGQVGVSDQISSTTRRCEDLLQHIVLKQGEVQNIVDVLDQHKANIRSATAQLDQIVAQQQNGKTTGKQEFSTEKLPQRISRDIVGFHEQIAAVESDPEYVLTKQKLNELLSLRQLYKEVLEIQQACLENWKAYENYWIQPARKRGEGEEKTRVRRYSVVVIVGMLLCWIAQWLWWAGYVGLAGDDYCPPKLPLLVFIWTSFSATGSIFGTTY